MERGSLGQNVIKIKRRIWKNREKEKIKGKWELHPASREEGAKSSGPKA